MKLSFFIFISLLIGVIESQHTNGREEEFKEVHKQCQSDPATNVDEQLFQSLKKGEDLNDAALKKHILCMNLKLNLQDENGDIVTETIRSDLEAFGEPNIDQIVTECGVRSEGDSNEETALKLYKCLHKHHNDENENKRTSAEEVRERVKKIRDECLADPETTMEGNLMEKLRNDGSENDEQLGKHVLCLNVKADVQNTNGDINKETIRKDLEGVHYDEEKVNNIVDSCGHRDAGDSATVSAVKLFKCLHQDHLSSGHN